jgi:hypothetical protein
MQLFSHRGFDCTYPVHLMRPRYDGHHYPHSAAQMSVRVQSRTGQCWTDRRSPSDIDIFFCHGTLDALAPFFDGNSTCAARKDVEAYRWVLLVRTQHLLGNGLTRWTMKEYLSVGDLVPLIIGGDPHEHPLPLMAHGCFLDGERFWRDIGCRWLAAIGLRATPGLTDGACGRCEGRAARRVLRVLPAHCAYSLTDLPPARAYGGAALGSNPAAREAEHCRPRRD